METVAEKRARLRRMKILENSKDRLNRIISGFIEDEFNKQKEKKQQADENKTDDDQQEQESQPQQHPHQHNILNSIPFDAFVSNEDLSLDTNQEKVNPIAQLFGRGDQVLPRKVSLISAPIHYRTLQQSQEFHSSLLNHPNIINNFRCNESSKLMIILFMLALFGSMFHVNIFLQFAIFQTFKFVQYKSIFTRPLLYYTLAKEMLVCLFAYIFLQAAIQIVK